MQLSCNPPHMLVCTIHCQQHHNVLHACSAEACPGGVQKLQPGRLTICSQNCTTGRQCYSAAPLLHVARATGIGTPGDRGVPAWHALAKSGAAAGPQETIGSHCSNNGHAVAAAPRS